MNNILRKLANTNKWQNYYARCKEIGGFRLFNNSADLSSIQTLFLNWLEVYSSLYHDLAMQKELLTEEVINDAERCEAYLLYRRKHKKTESKNKKQIDTNSNIPSIRFKRKVN